MEYIVLNNGINCPVIGIGTFMLSPAEAEKSLVPFSTHEGSGLSGFDKKLSSSIPGSTVLRGLTMHASSQERIS